MQRKDYFTELKMEIVRYSYDFTMLRETIVVMLETNRWVLEDINLCESFYHLQEMVEITYQEFTEFVEEIKILDRNMVIFNINDLLDYFDYIKENIHLESMYMTNMIDYMAIIMNHSIEADEIVERCTEYDRKDSTYLNQMKLNNDGLKKLKKERRDSFE